jgi:hypothetical protein
VFAELQPLWKQALARPRAAGGCAKASLQLRQAMIAEAEALGAAASLRIDAIKALQQRWQAEASPCPWIASTSKGCGTLSASPWTMPSTARRRA